MLKQIVNIILLMLFITVTSNINIKPLQAEEIKDYNYYRDEFFKKGCKVIKELQNQSNYKEILKLKKEYEDNSVNYIALKVAECLKEGNYEEYNLDIFLNNKDILMLKGITTDLERQDGSKYTGIYYVAIYFAAYYKGWAPEDVDILQLRSTSSGCTVWDIIRGWYKSNKKAEALKQRVLAQENTPPFF